MQSGSRLRVILFSCILLLSPSFLFGQAKGLRELNTSYPLGGSTSFFWVAYRSGSFEKYGLKLKPVYIRGSVTAIQSLLAKELFIQMEAGAAGIRAWARGAKEVTFIGAVGNRLDYILVTVPTIRKAEELKAYTLLARKAGYPVLIDISKQEFQYPISAVLTTRSFIRAEPETVMNFMRGLAEGMDFYRDESNKDKVVQHLGEYYRSNAREELEETRRAYSQLTPGLPVITAKSIENVIVNDKDLSGMSLSPVEILDLSFLQRLEKERPAKGR